jgi:hypothetical protein
MIPRAPEARGIIARLGQKAVTLDIRRRAGSTSDRHDDTLRTVHPTRAAAVLHASQRVSTIARRSA